MKLCIVKPDGTVAEILLRDRQPSFEAFNNEQLFIIQIIYVFLTIFLYLLKCPQSLIL